ncbi:MULTISPECIES: AsmA-like C-terminal region-containing protein [unclassified Arenibacter]|uniref:AsmA-like C-terminal region-containing protein n=1 Tax=unclassified Arenibacter TaxID=2615047 RepID=UPI000E34A5E0|nr:MULTISPECIES: AsmA-like C-terminal region-containing protein [unclassified Arenibacter]MCM4164965.1 AsmA family protein [Arenibacter sp. A80]RFT55373.1 AsmA family protein [Arenibacter sp. P308M17]
MKNKILKIVGGVVLVIVLLLIATPFFLKGKIADIIKNKVNNSINASFDFSDADLSLFRSFPNASVTLDNITLINKAPFEGDTLFASDKVRLDMSIRELFKEAKEPIAIKSLILDRPRLNIKVDKDENANYDIANGDSSIPDAPADTDSSESGFNLSMESYAINNALIMYNDHSSGMSFVISEMNHNGQGDLSLDKSELDTKTSGLVSFVMDSTQYLNKNPVQLKALIGVDLNENKYSFLKNEAIVNQLALVFDGFVKLNEDDQEVNISFKTPSSDFKNFLAVIPEVYSKDIAQVSTTGNFTVAGEFKGIVDDDHIPQFKIDINSENASFKYPDLPKAVRNVYIDTEISNSTGITEDTFVDIRKLSFMIDEDKFNMVAKISDLMGNTKVNAHIDGKMNLANISKAYPVPADLNLKGILVADISTAFDMASIEKKKYENTKTSGDLKLSDFEYKSDEFPNPIILKSTSVTFNPTTVTLNSLAGATGKTDFDASGSINNLLGFMFNNENIEGNFNLSSNTFAVNDFMMAEAAEVSGDVNGSSPISTEEKIKIPSFLDCTINATANTVIYDNLTLKDVKGTLVIRDEKAILSNMTSSIFDGKLALNGEVSTKGATPTFAMKLGMESFKIAETFKALEMFRTLAPIARILQGTLNSDVQLSGSLKDDFTPNLNTISGNLLAELLTDKIDAESAPLLTELDNKLNFLNLEKLNLKDLKTTLSFEDGVVKVKPFTIKYQDFAINVAGSHTFDQKLNYAATIEVPAKYLGKDINNIIARIDENSLENLTIPVTANIGGGYTSPTVTTDLTSGIKNLTAQLVEIEKQKLIAKGKDKAKDIIGDLIAKNQKATDSTKKENEEKTMDVIGGLLGAATKKTDSTAKVDTATTAKKEAQKDVAKKILGGLLGKKKEATETKKDSAQ